MPSSISCNHLNNPHAVIIIFCKIMLPKCSRDLECINKVKHLHLTYIQNESWNFTNKGYIHSIVPNYPHACQTCVKVWNLGELQWAAS